MKNALKCLENWLATCIVRCCFENWLARLIIRFWKREKRKVQDAQIMLLLSRMESVGEGAELRPPCCVRHPEKIKIGKNVCIGARSRIYANGGLEIGDNTRISANVVVLTENHRYEADRLPYGYQNDERPIKIGRNVWIGLNVCITPGTIIGDGAIIGMGSVVSGRVPPLAIVGPAKWRVLLYRDKEKYRRLDTAGQYFSESSVMRSYICAHKFFDMKG